MPGYHDVVTQRPLWPLWTPCRHYVVLRHERDAMRVRCVDCDMTDDDVIQHWDEYMPMDDEFFRPEEPL